MNEMKAFLTALTINQNLINATKQKENQRTTIISNTYK